MESKKNPKVDLEKKRSLFVQLGFILALSIVLFAFELKQYERESLLINRPKGETVIQEDIIQTEQQKQETPPPPKQMTTVLEIVEDDEEILEDIEIDIEADEETIVEEFEFTEETEEDVEEEEIFMFVEEMAEFTGGESALYQFLAENMVYPEQARDAGIEGIVYIKFVVEKDGSITKVSIERDIGGGCGEEAQRVVKMMPKWKPAKQRNRRVRSWFMLPVEFTLQK